MPEEKKGHETPLVKTGDNVPKLASGQRQDFTYKKLTDFELSGASFRQSLFIGSVFQRCRFSKVDFDRCDFSGATFADCVFEDCSFVPDEIRSCTIKTSAFINCQFRGAQWLRVDVAESSFTNCDFREASIRETSFAKCAFSECITKRSSLTLAEFNDCEFGTVNFGDCTALFLFFHSCTFDRTCRMNAETIGFTYGLSENNLRSLRLIYLGKAQGKPKDEEVIDALIATYEEKRWFVGACVLKLNFHRSNPVSAIRLLCRELDTLSRNHIRVDWDELRFFVDVLHRLHREERLPLLGLWEFVRVTRMLSLDSGVGASSLHTDWGSGPILAQADKLLFELIDALLPALALVHSTETMQLELRLVARPQTSLSALISSKVLTEFGARPISLVSGRAGSWIEIWQIGLAALAAIQISLAAVNGVMNQFVKVIDNAKRISKKLKKSTAPKIGRESVEKSALSRVRKHALSVQAEVGKVRRGAETPSLENLGRLDSALIQLSHLSERQLNAFQDYSIERIEAIRVRKIAPRASITRGRRERRISA